MPGRGLYRAAMAAAFALLLLAYAAASYLLFAIPGSSPLVSAADILFPLWNTGYSITIEAECLCLVALVSALAFLSSRQRGTAQAFVRMAQAASLAIMPLGLMMLASPSGYGFLFVRVMNFQAKYGFVPWFTNEDLLALSSSVFVLSLLAERLVGRRSRSLK